MAGNGKPQIVFQAIGGPYDGDQLKLDPPIRWMHKALVLPDLNSKSVFHSYVFNRMDYSARYHGKIVPNSPMGISQ